MFIRICILFFSSCIYTHRWRLRMCVYMHVFTAVYVFVRVLSLIYSNWPLYCNDVRVGYVSIRQHMSAYVSVSIRQNIFSIRQNSSAYVSIRQHTSAYVSIRQHASAYVQHTYSIRQYISVYVSMRKHTSAFVSIRPYFFCLSDSDYPFFSQSSFFPPNTIHTHTHFIVYTYIY